MEAADKYRFTESARAFIETSRIPFAVYQLIDNRVCALAVSAGLTALLGFDDPEEARELMDANMYRDTHPDDLARVSDAAMRFALEDSEYDVVYRWKRADSYRIVHARGEHVLAEDGSRLAVIWYTDECAYDPTSDSFADDLQASFNETVRRESMQYVNYYDSLTGLPNMTHFFELAEAGCRRLLEDGELPAILYVNLSGMQRFNDMHGFSEGDRVIKAVASALSEEFGNESCGRFAQDHFAVYAPAEGLEGRIEKVFRTCESANGGKMLPLRIGIYLSRSERVGISTACDRAKAAGYSSADVHTSCYRYFDDNMLEQTELERRIIGNLDRALSEGWIEVFHQPIIRSANGLVCDEEALARWHDPVKGLLTPDEFMPILEDAKAAYKLDLYVIDRILLKLKCQQKAGLHIVPESVNISRTDFDSCDIVEEVRKRVDESGFPRSMLNIEITESVIGKDFDYMRAQIDRFRSLGFKVWMDDFGSGYSSLDVLKNVKFDLIKFDMKFLEDFEKHAESKIIMTELIKMAIGLGIDTIAEGVETQEQVDFLREVGCSKLQGFYYCPPITFEKILERNKLGTQIGFENPEESDYYATIGKVNLYDMAVFAQEGTEAFENYFNTLPMAIIESTDDAFMLVRCNDTYRSFMERMFGIFLVGVWIDYEITEDMTGNGFLETLRQCGKDGHRAFIDEQMSDGGMAHAFVHRVAVNPVTGTRALAVAVLAIIDKKDQKPGATYAQIARALTSDFLYLYYVDLDTDDFIEYSSNATRGELSTEKHGEDFFEKSKTDALTRLYSEDVQPFVESFTKENVLRALDEHGSLTLAYRLIIDGKPNNMILKAVRMSADDKHIIVGVRNLDARTH